MALQLFINVSNKSNVFSFDPTKKSMNEIKDDLFQFVEDRTEIHKMFFRLTMGTKSFRWCDDCSMMLTNNSTLQFDVTCPLKKVRIKDGLHMFIGSNLLKESNLIMTMHELKDDGLISNDEDIVHLGDSDIISKNVIENWIMLSYYLKNHFQGDVNFYKVINLPKPLPNNYLDKLIGLFAYDYLNNLDLEEIKNLATFCDFMDISYLLEIVCAFIANKYVKNKSVDEIKNLNLI